MKRVASTFVCLILLGCFAVQAQKSGEFRMQNFPPFRVDVYFAGKLVDSAKGAPANAPVTDIKLVVADASQGNVVLKEAMVSLARGPRRVGSSLFQPGLSTLPLSALGSVPGDRIVIELTNVVYIKPDGQHVKLNLTPVYNIPLY